MFTPAPVLPVPSRHSPMHARPVVGCPQPGPVGPGVSSSVVRRVRARSTGGEQPVGAGTQVGPAQTSSPPTPVSNAAPGATRRRSDPLGAAPDCERNAGVLTRDERVVSALRGCAGVNPPAWAVGWAYPCCRHFGPIRVAADLPQAPDCGAAAPAGRYVPVCVCVCVCVKPNEPVWAWGMAWGQAAEPE